MYQSRAACPVFMFFVSFSTITNNNLILFCMLDQLVSIMITSSKSSKLFVKYGWIPIPSIIVIGVLINLPVLILSRWMKKSGKIGCWFTEAHQFLELSHALFSNAGLVQLILVMVISCAMAVHVKRQLTMERRFIILPNIRQKLHLTLGLFSISFVYVLFALPLGVTSIIRTVMEQHRQTDVHGLQVVAHVRNISWNVYFVREFISLILYYQFIKPVRKCIRSTGLMLRRCITSGPGTVGKLFKTKHNEANR